MNRQILYLAIPNILSNLSIPLLGVVDTALVGHLDGLYYLGAIAIGSMIFNFIYWGFGFLRMGTTGLTAQAFGNKDTQESILILARALFVALFASIGLLCFQTIIADISFKLVDASTEVERYGRSYFNIRIWAAPATLGLYAFHGWFLGMQNATYPMILAISGNVANIAFSVLFVRVFNLNSDGIAWGTVLAQYFGLLLALFLFLKKYRSTLDFLVVPKIFNSKALIRFFNINRDIFIRTICLVFTFTYFTAKSAEFGDVILGVNTILLQLWSILAYGIDGFAFAAESLVGKMIGEKNRKDLNRLIAYLFGWAIGLGLIITMIYYFFAQQILSLFTDKPQIIETAMFYFGWTLAAPLVNGVCFIWDGVFIGATDSSALRNSMIFCTFLIFLPLFYFTRDSLGNHSLWLAMLSFMLFRGITLTCLAYKRIPTWIPA